jgi:hypothetical protein
MTSGTKNRICFVVSSPITASAFLRAHIHVLSERFTIDLAANCPDPAELELIARHARVMQVPLQRKISPLSDLYALVRLYVLFRQEKYVAVFREKIERQLEFDLRVPLREGMEQLGRSGMLRQ